mgnify:CR=1 FL=1|jgi:hypothetical protein
MGNINSETFEKRDNWENGIMEQIFEVEKVIAPVVKKGDVIEFEISISPVPNDDITGKYEIIVVEKNKENIELAIREVEAEYDDIILFSELSLLLDSKLIKVLLFAINSGGIGKAVNKMNHKIWKECKTIDNLYL